MTAAQRLLAAAAGSGGAAQSLVEAAQMLGALTILPMTDVSGTAVTDLGTLPRAGSTYGAGITLGLTPPGDLDGCVEFPGGSGTTGLINLNTQNNGNDSNGETPWAIEAVLNLDTTGGDQTLVGFNSAYRIVFQADGALRSDSNLGSVSGGAGSIPYGSWFHVVVAARPKAGTMTLHVNGSPVTLSDPNGETVSVVMARIGSFGSTTLNLDGKCAYFAVYGTPLTDAECADHYALAGI